MFSRPPDVLNYVGIRHGAASAIPASDQKASEENTVLKQVKSMKLASEILSYTDYVTIFGKSPM